MKDEDDKDLDKLFRDRLQDSENLFAYNEEDWLALEAKMDKKDSRRAAIYWLRIGSGIAAILLLCFGWWFFTDTAPRPQTSAANKTKIDEKKLPIKIESQVAPNSIRPKPVTNNVTNNLASRGNATSTSTRAKNIPIQQYQVFTPMRAKETGPSQQGVQLVMPRIDTNKTALANAPVKNVDQGNTIEIANVDPTMVQQNLPISITEPIKTELYAVKKEKQPITFALSVIAASDLNGTSALKQTEVGTNYGALFNIGVSKKLTLQTGLIYSDKPYQANNDSYKTTYTSPYATKYSPISVFVNCKMFDVPINIDYLAFENKSNKISFGTGLSSYIMLHENYEYSFDPASNYATKYYDVPNSKSYLFSILNLSATYERKLSNRFGLTVQPYFKMPLRAVGYGNIKLQSAGVSLGLKMNLNNLGRASKRSFTSVKKYP